MSDRTLEAVEGEVAADKMAAGQEMLEGSHDSISRSSDSTHDDDILSPTSAAIDLEKQARDNDDLTDAHDLEPIRTNRSNRSTNLVARTLSRISTTVSVDPGPAPDGGVQAWTQCAMAHLVIFNTWGYLNSFGVFQTYYTAALSVSPSAISWVGSIQVWLLFFIGTFSGRALDAGLFRPCFAVGMVFQLLGVFLTSLCTQYWQLFLAQGVCTGIGNGIIFCPTVALVSTYWSRRRAFALGVATIGSATGGVVFPIIVRQLLPTVGFGWTVRVQGFVMLACLSVVLAFARPRLPPRKTGPIVEWAAFRETPYLLFNIGSFLVFWGLYFAFYYLASFARSEINISYSSSIILLLLLNGVGIPCRLIPGLVADHYLGALNTFIPFVLLCCLLLYVWIAIADVAGMYAFACIYGLGAAGLQSLFPACLGSLTPDVRKLGVRMGMVFSVISFACLTGPPLGGALVGAMGGRYLAAQLWSATCMVVGIGFLVAARMCKTGGKVWVKC